jgi:iron-sulfur cluster repair protein YtfE (RIC family)
MSQLNRLCQEHADLIAIAGRLSVLIAHDTPPPSNVLYRVRQEFASALIHHLKSEDWVLYPRLLVSRDRHVAATALLFSREMGGLATAFREFAEQWGSFAIEGDWKRYQRETAEFLAALTDRITRENHDLYPLFEAVDVAA